MTSGKLFDSLNLSFPNYKMGIITQGYGGSLKEVMTEWEFALVKQFQ